MSKKSVFQSLILLALAVLMTVTIYKLSDMNTNNSNGKSTDIIGLFIEDTLDFTNKYDITDSHPDDKKIAKASLLLNAPLRKVMHASVYFVLAFLIVFFINSLSGNRYYLLSAFIAILLIFLLASLDKFHQTFVPGRTGQFKDVIIDSIGGMAGILFYVTYYIVYRRGVRTGKIESKDEDDLDDEE